MTLANAFNQTAATTTETSRTVANEPPVEDWYFNRCATKVLAFAFWKQFEVEVGKLCFPKAKIAICNQDNEPNPLALQDAWVEFGSKCSTYSDFIIYQNQPHEKGTLKLFKNDAGGVIGAELVLKDSSFCKDCPPQKFVTYVLFGKDTNGNSWVLGRGIIYFI